MNMHVWSCSYTLRTSCQSKLRRFVPVPFHMCNIISTFILTVKIPCDYHPWGTSMTPFQTPCIRIERQRVRQWWKERERARWESGRGVARASTELWDVMHIHENHLHLSCERKCGKMIKKKTHTHAEAFVLYVQAARCLRSCEKHGCLTWLSIRRAKADFSDDRKGKRGTLALTSKWILNS